RLYRRLHLIHGDSNVLPAALFLKVGTTRLVLDLLDADEMPDLTLGDAVSALRQLSRVLAPPWWVTLQDGRKKDGLEMLETYRQKAAAMFRGRDAETDAILQLWEWVHQALASNRNALVGIVDWISKEFLFQAFREEEGIEWGHPWFESLDLEYHQIDPDRSLALPLAKEDGPWCPSRVAQARHEPPANSRAHARSRLMREIVEKDTSYFLDWEAVEMANHKRTRLLDPFQP
ncbi:MAG TPA: proteasome accessory factor PafA2 family protein, partial [Candidatus Dormibacteraeota bacterium]|nr:proteasome accessory factor PafA2 family protein [Candidatus Dormibacteraeota bacterium]